MTYKMKYLMLAIVAVAAIAAVTVGQTATANDSPTYPTQHGNYTHPTYINDTNHPPHIYPDHIWDHPQDMEPTVVFDARVRANDQQVDGAMLADLRVISGHPEGAAYAFLFYERHVDPRATHLPSVIAHLDQFAAEYNHPQRGTIPNTFSTYYWLSHESNRTHYVMQATVIYTDLDYNYLAWGAFKDHIAAEDVPDLVYRWDIHSTTPTKLNMTANQTAQHLQVNEHVKDFNDAMAAYDRTMAEFNATKAKLEQLHTQLKGHHSDAKDHVADAVSIGIRLGSQFDAGLYDRFVPLRDMLTIPKLPILWG